MNNRWTIKQLDETDDLTFAMCILSERRGDLNQEAPLAKKLKRAYHVLEELRDICREQPTCSAKEAIFRSVEREYTLEDIKAQIKDSDHLCLELGGLEPDDVIADREILSRIFRYADKSGCGDEYWHNLDYAIEQGINDVLEERKAKEVNS